MINFIIALTRAPMISEMSAVLADYNADDLKLEIVYSNGGIEVALSNPGIPKKFTFYETDTHLIVLSGYIRKKGTSEIILPAGLIDFTQKPRAHVFAGMFCLCVIDKDKRTVHSWNTLCRQIPLYYTKIKNNFGMVIGTRSSLLTVVRERGRPRVNPMNLYPFYGQGFHVLETTPFHRVNVAPANSFIKFSENEVLISKCSDILDRFSTEPPSSELFDNLAGILAHSVAVRPYLDDGAAIDIGITGGRDSRLLFAALKHSGADFTSYTIGNGGHPDVEIGRLIAETTGVSHRVVQKNMSELDATVKVNVEQQVLTTLFHSDWAASGYDRLGTFDSHFTARYGVNGAFGGLLRGGYPNLRSLNSKKNIALSKLSTLLSDFDLLTEEAFVFGSARADGLRKYISRLDSTDGLDQLHLLTRAGRWASATFMATRNSVKLTPFADNEFLHETYKLEGRSRVTGILLFELLRRYDQGLAYLPFMGKTYSFVDNPPRGYEDFSSLIERPIIPSEDSTSYFNWRFAMDGALGTFLQENISDHLEGDLRHFLDQRKVHDLMDQARAKPNDRTTGRLMWGLYSTAIICRCYSRSESREMIRGTKPLNIPVVASQLV